MNKIQENIFKIIKNPLFIIMVIVVLFRIVFLNFYYDYWTYPDTKSYVNTFNQNILIGEVNPLRTPVYPYIIKFLDIFSNSEETLFKSITIFQGIISLLSVVIFYFTLKNIFKNKKVINITTLFYGCLPVTFLYNKAILTESLAISGFIFFFYLIVNYLKKPKIYKIILISVYTFLLIMLRPSFLFVLIVLFALYVLKLIFDKNLRKQAIIGIVSIIGVILLITGYGYLNFKTNGFKGLSYVTVVNQTDRIIKMNIYGNYQQGDEKFVEIIKNNYKQEEDPWYNSVQKALLEEYTYSEIDEYNKRCIKNNIGTYVKQIIKNTLSLSSQNLFYQIIHTKTETLNQYTVYYNQTIFPLSFGFVYMLIALELIYLLYVFIKNKKIQWIRLILIMIIAGQFATVLIGAQAEYRRLVIPAVPFIIILIASHIDQLYYYKKEKQIDYIN